MCYKMRRRPSTCCVHSSPPVSTPCAPTAKTGENLRFSHVPQAYALESALPTSHNQSLVRTTSHFPSPTPSMSRRGIFSKTHLSPFSLSQTKQEVEAAPDAEDVDPRHSILSAGMDRNTSQPRTLEWSPLSWMRVFHPLGVLTGTCHRTQYKMN